jgi:hypothetical protein
MVRDHSVIFIIVIDFQFFTKMSETSHPISSDALVMEPLPSSQPKINQEP